MADDPGLHSKSAPPFQVCLHITHAMGGRTRKRLGARAESVQRLLNSCAQPHTSYRKESNRGRQCELLVSRWSCGDRTLFNTAWLDHKNTEKKHDELPFTVSFRVPRDTMTPSGNIASSSSYPTVRSVLCSSHSSFTGGSETSCPSKEALVTDAVRREESLGRQNKCTTQCVRRRIRPLAFNVMVQSGSFGR